MSARLGAAAPVKNQLFPKTRSWFALGAPLELMSPLSLLRIVLALDALVELTLGPVLARPGTFWAVLAIGLATLALWLALFPAKAPGASTCTFLVVASEASVAGLVWTSSPAASIGYAALVVPSWCLAALFFPLRRTLGVLALGVGAVVAAAALTAGAGALAPGVVGLGAGGGAATLTVWLLTRSGARQRQVDPDTGLPNGFGLVHELRRRPDWSSFVVAAVVLEGVGEAREALGYRVGTELLRRAVEDLGQVLPDEALIGRVVADELVVVRRLAPGAEAGFESALGEARAVAAALGRAIAAGRYVCDGVDISVRTRIGLAVYPFDGGDVEDLIRRASLSAAEATTNAPRAARHDPARRAMTADDLALLAELARAEERGELSLAYQPQISASRGCPVGAEALLRWTSPSAGPVSPGRFVVLAERTGLIERLTDWVVAEALDAQVRWRALGVDLPVAVNVSARSLSRPDLAGLVLHELAERSLSPTCLTLEVTETAAASDLAEAVGLLRPLHDKGVRISIDDFGTGFTSLAVLPELPLSELKVDQRFVRRATASGADAAIVAAVRELAGRLGLDAVAEGVEDEPACRFLLELGYDLLQGFHFSRPLAEADLLAFVAAADPLDLPELAGP